MEEELTKLSKSLEKVARLNEEFYNPYYPNMLKAWDNAWDRMDDYEITKLSNTTCYHCGAKWGDHLSDKCPLELPS